MSQNCRFSSKGQEFWGCRSYVHAQPRFVADGKPVLDQALGMPEGERAAWLAWLRQENPALAALLQTLLDEHRVLAREHFLEQTPVPLPGAAALAGQSIGAYTMVSAIGQGGMGSVWLAQRSDGRF